MYIVIHQVTQNVPNPYYPGPGDMNPTMSETSDVVRMFHTDEQLKAFIEDNARDIGRFQFYKAEQIKPRIKALIDFE